MVGDVVQIRDELRDLVRSRAERALVLHDRELESGMPFRLGPYVLRGLLLDRRRGAIPVDDHPVETAGDHVFDLTPNLLGIVRVVAGEDMSIAANDVVRIAPRVHAEPRQKVRVEPRRGAGVQKRARRQLANVPRCRIPGRPSAAIVGVAAKGVRGAGVVGALAGKRRLCNERRGREQKNDGREECRHVYYVHQRRGE